jgi:UDP-N-acetylmuramyl pentapeptide phosphotransferase/UDP-N-acetylglucosamine-1-phosphate transferase
MDYIGAAPGWVCSLVVIFAACAISAILCRLVMRLGVVDAPTEVRKQQAAPVPTSGGLGFAVSAVAAAWVALRLGGLGVSSDAWIVVAGAMAALVLGFADDARNIGARLKLGVMTLIAIAMAVAGVCVDQVEPWPGQSWMLPIGLAIAGSVIWLVLVVNAVNFMDGANGLAMSMSAIAAAGLGACAGVIEAWDIALLAFGVCGALIGFLVWNIPGRLFAGDAGALFVGAILAGLSLLLVQARPDWLFVPAIILSPFLTDVVLTLVWRASMGKPLFRAHRDHVYQIALKAGLTHAQTAGVHAVWAVNATALGVVAAISGGYVPALTFLALQAAGVWAHLRARKSGVKAGLVGREIA